MPSSEFIIVAVIVTVLLWVMSILGGVALGGHLVHKACTRRPLFGASQDDDGDMIEDTEYDEIAVQRSHDIFPSVVASDSDFAAPDMSDLIAEQNARFQEQISREKGGNHAGL